MRTVNTPPKLSAGPQARQKVRLHPGLDPAGEHPTATRRSGRGAHRGHVWVWEQQRGSWSRTPTEDGASSGSEAGARRRPGYTRSPAPEGPCSVTSFLPTRSDRRPVFPSSQGFSESLWCPPTNRYHPEEIQEMACKNPPLCGVPTSVHPSGSRRQPARPLWPQPRPCRASAGPTPIAPAHPALGAEMCRPVPLVRVGFSRAALRKMGFSASPCMGTVKEK